MSTADAVIREAAWLNAYSPADGLPNLVAPAGPWTKIQAYVPRVEPQRQPAVYVLRHDFRVERISNGRSRATYEFRLKLVWPLSTGTGSAEEEAQNFDNAIDLLLQRIYGPLLDKTHGGRFLSVAENPHFVTVQQEDPDVSIPSAGSFFATVHYAADDNDFVN